MTGFKLKPAPRRKFKAIPLPAPGPEVEKDAWFSPGVGSKPPYCAESCPLATVTTGIVYDHVPPRPKVTILLTHPAKDDVATGEPWSSGMGAWWFWKFVESLGRSKDDVALGYVLRCYPGKDYPTGKHVVLAEKACRLFDHKHRVDGKILEGGFSDLFDPNLFVATFNMYKAPLVGAFYRLIKMDVEKAFMFADYGYRPLLLSGTETLRLVAPWTAGRGGIKYWRGHWWEGEWPFKYKWVIPQHKVEAPQFRKGII